jgi:hypothetical protein
LLNSNIVEFKNNFKNGNENKEETKKNFEISSNFKFPKVSNSVEKNFNSSNFFNQSESKFKDLKSSFEKKVEEISNKYKI